MVTGSVADYDLGRAHGEIVVDADTKGADRADKALSALRAQAVKLQDQLKKASASLKQHEDRLRQMDAQAKKVAKSTAAVAASVGKVAANAGRAASGGIAKATRGLTNLALSAADSSLALAGLDGDLVQTVRRLKEMQSAVKGVYESFQELTSVSGLLNKLTGDIFGISEQAKSIGHFRKSILSAASAIAALGATRRGILWLGRSSGLFAAATAGMAALATRTNTLRNSLRSLTLSLAGMSPRFAAFLNGLIGIENRTRRTAVATRLFSAGISTAIRGMAQMVTGGLLLTKAFTGMAAAGKYAAMAIGGLGLGAAAIEILGVAVLGLWDAMKQLSGIVLILPGALMTLGIAGGVVKLAMVQAKEAFKAAALTGEEFNEAIKKLGPEMQHTARAAQALYQPFQDLKKTAAEAVFKNLGYDIEALGKTYMPMLQRGIMGVGQSMNKFQGGLVDFALQPATISDLNRAFGLTESTMDNLAKAVWPLLAAFRDIGMVGMEVLNELSGGAGGAAAKFGNFISEARKTGELKTIIYESIQGFKDLVSIIVDSGAIVATFFTGFGSEGENALARLAKGADNLRAKLEASASGGTFDEVTNALQRMSEQTFDTLGIALQEIGQVLSHLGEFAEEASEAFGGALASSLRIAGGALEIFASALDAIGGSGVVIGGVLGIAAGMKLIQIALVPLIRSMQTFAGTFLLLRGAGTTLAGVTTAISATGVAARLTGVQMGALGTSIALLGTRIPIIRAMQTAFLQAAIAATTFGRAAGIAAAAATGFRGAASGALALLGGPYIAALLAVVGVFYSFKAQSDAVAKAQEAMSTKSDNAADSVKNLTKAFDENNGVMQGSVFTAIGTELDTLKTDLNAVAKTGTGLGADIGAMFKDMFSSSAFRTGQGDAAALNDTLDVQAGKARNAAAAIEDLGMSNEELSAALGGSNGEYQQVVSNLQAMGEWGRDAIAELDPLRQKILDTQSSFARMEPGAVALSNALEKIGTEGASSADKLDGLKAALGALGLIQQTTQQAAFEYQQQLREMGDATQYAVDANSALGTEMLNTDGTLNTANANAYNLNEQMVKLAEGFLTTTSEGNNAQAAYADMIPIIENLSNTYGLSVDKIKEFLTQMGVQPEAVDLIMRTVGTEKAEQDINALILKMQQFGGMPPMPIQIQSVEAQEALRQVGAQVDVINATTGEVRVVATTEQVQAALALVQAEKNKTAQPAIIPTGTTGVPATVGSLGEVAAAADKIPGQKFVSTSAPDAPETVGSLQDVIGAAAGVETTPATVPVQTTGVPETIGSLGQVAAVASEPTPPVTVNTTITGDGDVISKLSSIQQACVDTGNQFADLNAKAGTAMDGVAIGVARMAESVASSFASVANTAYNSGAALGQGFADGISSKAGAVQAAALQLAEAASAPLPRSPAKIGPFSGTGWTPYRGTALAQGFAQGILKGAPLAKNATMDLATIVANALDSISAQFGGPQMNFGANLPGASTKYFRDPEVSDAELADRKVKRDEEARKEAKEKAKEDAKDKAREEYDARKKLEEGAENKGTTNESGKPTVAQGTLSTAAGKASVGEGDIVTAIGKLAKVVDPSLQVTSGLREGDPGHHGTGNAADISNGQSRTPEQLKFANFLADNFRPFIKELIYDDPSFNKNIADGQFVDRSYYGEATMADHQDHVHAAFDQAPTWVPGVTAKMEDVVRAQEATAADAKAAPYGDSEQQKVAQAIIAEGKARGKSNEEIQGAISAGIVESGLRELNYGDRDSVGPFQQRTPWGTVEQRTNAESSAKLFYDAFDRASGDTVAERVANTQRPQEDLRGRYAEEMGEAAKYMTAYADGTAAAYGKNADNFEDFYTADDPTALTAEMAEAVRIANDPKAADADVIQALNRIDQGIATGDESQIEQLEEVKDATLDARGLKAYDPFEGATEDPLESGMSVVKDLFSLIDTIEGGFKAAAEVFALGVRGLSNTADVNRMVDGVQSVISAVGSVVSTVGSIVSTVSSIAALAGAAIPGIGQVGTVISALTGGIASFNGIIDLIQEGMGLLGRVFGGFLSGIAGGADGALYGKITTLVDTNDGTIKTWSDANPSDKRERKYGSGTGDNINNRNGGIDTVNLYTGPGVDPQQMIGDMMFAVKAGNAGVYAGV